MSWVVMGREFYSSWPVRVFSDREPAEAFARLLNDTYEELRKTTAEDTDKAAFFEIEGNIGIIADSRAQLTMRERGLDLQAGGLDLSWKAVEVPDGAP